jgi:hypothetical protein
LRLIVQLQLTERVLDVVLDRPMRQRETLGDLPIRQALRDEAQNFGLPAGQPGRAL